MTKRIIGIVLTALVVVIGTAHAQEPEPSTIQAILGDSEKVAVLESLPTSYQQLADKAFSVFKVETPEKYLYAHTEWLIDVLKEHHDQSSTPVQQSLGAVMSLPGYVADLFAMEGYSSAFTGILIQAEEVGAEVAAGNAWQRAICEDCNFISAVVYQPTACGHHSVWGRHWTRNPHAPTQISYASVNIDC